MYIKTNIVGEVGVLFDVKRTATVIAKTPCILMCLNGEKLKKLLDLHDQIKMQMHHSASTRVQTMAKAYGSKGRALSEDITNRLSEFGISNVLFDLL